MSYIDVTLDAEDEVTPTFMSHDFVEGRAEYADATLQASLSLIHISEPTRPY